MKSEHTKRRLHKKGFSLFSNEEKVLVGKNISSHVYHNKYIN